MRAVPRGGHSTPNHVMPTMDEASIKHQRASLGPLAPGAVRGGADPALGQLRVQGQKAKYSLGVDVFRFAPESGLKSDIAPCPKGANHRLMHRSKPNRYSITSSARASSVGGMSRPSALAVFRLMTRSNLVGCSTGISPGFAPRSILSTKSAARRNKSGKFDP